MNEVMPPALNRSLCAAIVLAQYLCGLATVTSASRMLFSFARDGGTPYSMRLRHVCPKWRTPVAAIWTVACASVLFTVWTPVYTTITAVCTIFLYISYVLPTALGLAAYGRWWTTMGPWRLGRWYRVVAGLSVAGCLCLIVIGMQPPNDKALWVVGGAAALLAAGWLCFARTTFPGPPLGGMTGTRRMEIERAEEAVHQKPLAGDAP